MIKIDIEKFQQMLIGGAECISKNFEYIDQLNVFPVPDGDTGSNMKVTSEGGATAIKGKKFSDLLELGKVYSRALLMNARGNSGVIFSQIFKGFVSGFAAGATELSIADLVLAFENAKNRAYKALTSPIEGTILTVIRVTSEKINEKKNTFKSIEELFEFALKESNDILLKTPDFLPDLKNAGVVDSGGCGLCKFLEGMNDVLLGKAVDALSNEYSLPKIQKKNIVENFEDNNEGFGYCCEFIMSLGSKVALSQPDKQEFVESTFKKQFLEFGECLVVVVDDNIVKVHVHTLDPYKVLQVGAKYGEFIKVKIENMTLQFLENNPGTVLEEQFKNATKKSNSYSTKTIILDTPKIIATVPTQTLSEIYQKQIKVDHVINYEINGNPSIQEFLNAFRAVKSSKIIVVVDDSNAMLAAKEAADLVKKTISVTLINAKDISLSYVACLAYNPIDSFDNNVNLIKKIVEKSYVKIARGSKEVKFGKVDIHLNDYIGIVNKNVICANKCAIDTMKAAAKQILNTWSLRRRHNLKMIVLFGSDATVKDMRDFEKFLNEEQGIKVSFIETKESIYSYHFVIG